MKTPRGKPKKWVNDFVLQLAPYRLGSKTYDGCKNVTQSAYGPEQAVTTHLNKIDRMDFAEHYVTGWEDNTGSTHIRLKYGDRYFDLDVLPKERKQLPGMRKFVAKKTEKKMETVKNMPYGKLYMLYNEITRVPVLAEILSGTISERDEKEAQMPVQGELHFK
ncbi:MAG: hypothetical protein NT120_02860 [Candidatus Aenigmarchaeota archaeon]|nr:hypothetical protein [Candidatus Aenigmarchaeota archaeon]